MWTKKQVWLGLVFLLTLFVSSFFFFQEKMFYTHDFLHGARIAEMARGLQAWDLPVIWSQNLGWGYGMPLFQFYAPLPYFLGALLFLCGLDLVWSVKLLFFFSQLVTFWAVYFWSKEIYNTSRFALLSAVLATLAPYRAMDIFARGALSEIWAIAFLPLLFYGLTKIAQRKTGGLFWSVLGGVGLALSHNITTLLAIPSVIIYVLILLFNKDFLNKKTDKKTSLSSQKTIKKSGFNFLLFSRQILTAGLLVAALSAFYLLPAFFEQDQTQLKSWILDDYFDYKLHFVYPKQLFKNYFGYGGSGYGPEDGLSFFLGWGQMVALFFAGATLFVQIVSSFLSKKGKTKNSAQLAKKKLISIKQEEDNSYHPLFYWGILFLCALNLWLTTYLSLVVWQWSQSLLAFAQFPWRFLSLALLFIAIIAPYSLSQLKSKFWQNLGLVLLLLLTFATSWRYFQGDPNQPDARAYYNSGAEDLRQKASYVLVDYLPKDFANSWEAVPLEQKVLSGSKPMTIIKDEPQEKIYLFNIQQPELIELPLSVYPQWQVKINQEKILSQTSVRGNLSFWLPAGENQVVIKLCPTPLRLFSNSLSLLTLSGLVVYFLWQKVQR